MIKTAITVHKCRHRTLMLKDFATLDKIFPECYNKISLCMTLRGQTECYLKSNHFLTILKIYHF
jgi:hypothetical protein